MWWITGCRGLLGREICGMLDEYNVQHYKSDMDVNIINPKSIGAFITGKQISGIINCAAYTNVEACEIAPSELINVNIIGAFNLAATAKGLDVPIIHFSTDYVFRGNVKGNRAYLETDPMSPINKYGLSKAYGDNHIRTICQKYYIFRISWLYGKHGANFVDKVIDKIQSGEGLAIVNDQIGSLTNAYDVARLVVGIIVKDPYKYGLYNFSGYGAASWFDAAVFISQSLYGLGVVPQVANIQPTTTYNANLKAKRPKFSYLSKQKIEESLGVEPIDWRDSLMSYIMSKFEAVYRNFL